ncbi:MAG: S-layer protein, partial [Methanosarcinales archaeon]
MAKNIIIAIIVIMLLFIGVSSAKTINVPINYTTIQEAVNAANSGDIIIVAKGIYYENIVINKSISL